MSLSFYILNIYIKKYSNITCWNARFGRDLIAEKSGICRPSSSTVSNWNMELPLWSTIVSGDWSRFSRIGANSLWRNGVEVADGGGKSNGGMCGGPDRDSARGFSKFGCKNDQNKSQIYKNLIPFNFYLFFHLLFFFPGSRFHSFNIIFHDGRWARGETVIAVCSAHGQKWGTRGNIGGTTTRHFCGWWGRHIVKSWK